MSDDHRDSTLDREKSTETSNADRNGQLQPPQEHIAPQISNTTSQPNQHHHAHHLKYGDIHVSGFAPPSDEEDFIGTNDVAACKFNKKHSQEDRQRKITKDRAMEAVDAESRRIQGQRRYLLRKPRALQYFRGKTLVRSDEERSSSRLELFFDLAFVGIIAVLAEEAVREPTGASLVRYLITYTAAYLIWSWMREIFNSFYKDDLAQRMLVLFVMACLVIYGNNAPSAQQNLSEGPARAATVGSYLVAEGAIFLCFFLYSFYVKQYRAQLRVHTAIWLCTSAIWIGCIFVDVKSAIAMAVVALFCEYGGWIFAYNHWIKSLLKLRYSSALNIEHEVERFNDFYTLVMGEFIFSLFQGQPAGIGIHLAAARAVLAIVIAFCFQLFYIVGANSKRITHPIRKAYLRGTAFFTLHIPIVSALTLCGDSMAELVREEHVESAIRWISCESYAIGMIGVWMLAMIEFERDEKGELWMPKWIRLTPRLLAGIIAIFLPLTHQHSPEGATEEPATTTAIRLLIRQAVEGEGSAASAAEPAAGTIESSGGVDITTTKLLAILACMSAFALIWEQVTSLDGPNAEHECANEHFLTRADDHSLPRAALSTPKWRGFPTLAEPGCGTFDRSHQRDHRRGMEKSASEMSQISTRDDD